MRALTWSAIVLSPAGAASAAAQPTAKRPGPTPGPKRPPPTKIEKAPPPTALIGVEAKGAFAPERGFLDDVVATADGRLGVVVTDGAGLVELQVISTADGGELTHFDVAAIAPAVRRFYLLGDDVFVVADNDDGAPVAGALLGADGKVKKAHKAATDLFVRPFAGQDAVIAYTLDPKAKGGTLHQVEAFDLLKAKKLTKKPGRMLIGKDGRDAKLDFRPAYFIDGMTVAVGTHGGVWRKKEDQRSPDTAAAWDLLAGKFVRDEPITDLLGRAHQLEVMTEHRLGLFARMKEDNSTIEVWRDGVAKELTLDQPLDTYVAASLAYATKGDTLWVSLMVDPVNAPAVARKKADPEYLDLFEVTGDRAVRRARIYAPKKKLRWGWAGDRLWVMEKNVGFDRGSKLLTLYALEAPLL